VVGTLSEVCTKLSHKRAPNLPLQKQGLEKRERKGLANHKEKDFTPKFFATHKIWPPAAHIKRIMSHPIFSLTLPRCVSIEAIIAFH